MTRARLRRWLKLDANVIRRIREHITPEELGVAINIVLDKPISADDRSLEDVAELGRLCVSAERWEEIRGNVLLILQAFSGKVATVDRMALRETVPAEVRRFVLNRDGFRCVYCGATSGVMHLDHILPVAKGGANDPDNLCVSCAPCNLSKGAKALFEWRDEKGQSQ